MVFLYFFGKQAGQDIKRDALRHAYFNAMNVHSFGLTIATNMANAHEDYVGNPTEAKAMDLNNNSVGRASYATFVSNGYISSLPVVVWRKLKMVH